MAFTDQNHTNKWVPEQTDGQVIQSILRNSAVEAVGRKVNMTTDLMNLPTGTFTGADLVAEGATVPVLDPTLSKQQLQTYKWANRFAQSSEDDEDSAVDFFNFSKNRWFSNWAVKFDNSCLGVTAAANGTTIPFTSVYKAATDASGVIATAGALTFEDLNDSFSALETGNYFDAADGVIIAHPALQGSIRNLKDAAGDRVVVDPLGNGNPTIFGYELVFSNGARTHATATDAPTGNPLLIVGAKSQLIVGVRSGPEYMVSSEAQWENDNIELKTRVRRAFVVGNSAAFRVVEITAA